MAYLLMVICKVSQGVNKKVSLTVIIKQVALNATSNIHPRRFTDAVDSRLHTAMKTWQGENCRLMYFRQHGRILFYGL